MTKRIKILITIPNFDTAGSGKVVYDLVKGMDKRIFLPEICCFHDRGAFFKEIQKLGIKIHLFEFAVSYRPFVNLPFRILKIYWFFKKNKFDIIHSWHWSSDITEPLAAKLAGIPLVYTKKSMSWGNKAWIWRSKLSTKIITINSDMDQQFFSKMAEKVVSIPLGVDSSYFKPLIKVNNTPKHLTFAKTDFVIVTVANLVPVKGVEILLEAIKRLNNDAIKTLIIGDYKNIYGEDMKTTYESKHVFFLGKQLDVRPYLALANVFVIPTKDEGRKEGLPIAPLEAMASGCIVVGSNISGTRDILKDYQELLFQPSDIEDLMRRLKFVRYLNEDETIKLKDAMRQIVLQHFSLDQFIESHEVLYQSLIR